MIHSILRPRLLFFLCAGCLVAPSTRANGNVHVSRFWHNHQPVYWPEWNTNGSETSRVEYAWDSIVLKSLRSYSGSSNAHPENNLADIFGKDDRRAAYQSGPRDALTTFDSRGGFAMSYSGSLIDNIRQLGGGGHLGYGPGWNTANTEARQWTTPSGGPRLDLVGFTYHHSLAPLLPKSVLRKEIRIFKQAWWKAWGGAPDSSDHSKGFFPTEMAFSRHIVDVLAEEGYEWVIVPSHHLSRTCPTYMDRFDLENGQYGIFSSPPNRADRIGPSPEEGWWYSEPNPGNAAWNVAPFAYQLHRVKHVNPETGEETTLVAVPSDDVLSYRYGYANEGIGKIRDFIAPFATDPERPVLVMPATDGDNAWGGGSSSWFEATPQLFNDAAATGYVPTTPGDFVAAHGENAPLAHIEDGAWIFPESDYGSPYFLKWIEPPVAAPGSPAYPGTVIDLETPGFALKFWSWAPVITGANWVETAEQILRDEGGSVQDWKIQAPYDWDGTYTEPNEVERAWHIYLAGLDSGFNYYGGLGNDDEVKPALAATRAIQTLQPWMTEARRANDRTPPTVLKPQRFPWNPGAYTFGWFNSVPGGDTNYLKKMPSDFYIWTHVYDLEGVASVTLKLRMDADGVNPLHDNQNETYAGGPDVGAWIDVPMTRRALPNDPASLNAAANNGEINYFITPPELADYYFAHITGDVAPEFRDSLLDYYIEAVDTHGNVRRSDIQHVYVEDDGEVTNPLPGPGPAPAFDLGAEEAPAGYLVSDPGMRIFAAVRGDKLYVATWTPSGGGNDHMIFVTDQPAAAADTPAPWDKAGTTAHPEGAPYLAAESDNDYIGWYNTPAPPRVWRDDNAGGRMEGVIDLADTFNGVPDTLYIAAVAYPTDTGSPLAAQAPAGNEDENLDADEFMAFPVEALRDSAATGTFDRLDPARGFRIHSLQTKETGAEVTLPVVPGRRYRLLISPALSSGIWTEAHTFQAASGQDTVTIRNAPVADRLFYRVEAVE